VLFSQDNKIKQKVQHSTVSREWNTGLPTPPSSAKNKLVGKWQQEQNIGWSDGSNTRTFYEYIFREDGSFVLTTLGSSNNTYEGIYVIRNNNRLILIADAPILLGWDDNYKEIIDMYTVAEYYFDIMPGNTEETDTKLIEKSDVLIMFTVSSYRAKYGEKWIEYAKETTQKYYEKDGSLFKYERYK